MSWLPCIPNTFSHVATFSPFFILEIQLPRRMSQQETDASVNQLSLIVLACHPSAMTTPNAEPYLGILNAEIKFHRYLRMISRNPPEIPLPADVLNLMHLTIELVDLLYWRPVRTNGPETEGIWKVTDEQ